MFSAEMTGPDRASGVVLLLESNAAARLSITDVAEELGLHVESCSTATACLERLDKLGDDTRQLRDPLAVVAAADEALAGQPALLSEIEDRVFTPPVVLTTAPLDQPDTSVLRRCVWDLIPKPTHPAAIRRALTSAANEGYRRVADRRLVLGFRRREKLLSRDEHEVLDAVCDGKLNKQIARELGVSVRTVEQRRRRVFTKMKVPSAVPLARQLATVRTLERLHSPRRTPTAFAPKQPTAFSSVATLT